MAKSKKRKNKKNPDFQKIKLKIGKKLKKTQDTNTKFKAQRILIPEQLRRTTTEGFAQASFTAADTVVTKKTLSELCQQLRHYNKNFRKDALNRLKQGLTANPETLPGAIPTILPALGSLICDDESEIRSSVGQILSVVFNDLAPVEMGPHFQLLTAHIACGLTHIVPAIKNFALKLIDILLDKYSDVCRSSPEFIETFLSCVATYGGRKTVAVSGGGQKLVGRESLEKMFAHLEKFLTVLLPDDSSSSSQKRSNIELKINLEDLENDEIEGRVRTPAVSLVPEYSICSGPFDLPVIYANALYETSAPLAKCANMENCVQNVIPFLWVVWREVATGSDVASQGRNQRDLTMMHSVIKMLLTLIKNASRLIEGKGAFSLGAEELKSSLQTLIRAKGFVKSFSEMLPVSGGQARRLNQLLAQFLLACDVFLRAGQSKKLLNMDLISRYCQSYAPEYVE